jgi:diaminopimelate epimerase
VSIRFVKGHGTENDFILIDDPEGALDLTAAVVARLCDRRTGLGADGLIRVIRTAGLLDVPASVQNTPDPPEWFMDYRNADGSVAQMCGNGVRVLAAHLLARGWIELEDGGHFTIGTRAGVKAVHRIKDSFGVDLGPWHLPGGASAIESGADAAVTVFLRSPEGAPAPNLPRLPGLSANLGNPHVVVALPSLEILESLDLSVHPVVVPMPSEGVNIEFMVPMHDASSAEGHLTMRVYERGVGETRSCGTGAVAAVLAARAWAGADAPVRWTVDVPGGRLTVELPDGSPLDAGPSAGLSGPAVLVADGTLLLDDMSLQPGAVARSTR